MKRNPRNIPVEPDDQQQEASESVDPIIEPLHPVLVAVAGHLAEHKIAYSVMATGAAIMFSMSEKVFTWSTVINVFDDRKLLHVAARLPLFVPAARRREAAALLSRLNYRTLIGAWQMDHADGEVIYVATHLFGDRIPEEDTIHTLCRVTCVMVGDEGPKILRLIRKSSGSRLQLPPPGSN